MGGHETSPDEIPGIGDSMSSANLESIVANGNLVGNGMSAADHKSGTSLSRMRQGDRLVNVDLQRITDVINGRIQSPKLITLKAIVRQQLKNIRSAQRRGMSIREIASAITDGGCPIEEPTLRKYLHLLGKEKQQSQKPPRKTKAIDTGIAEATAMAPVGVRPQKATTESGTKDQRISIERSLRRARLVSNPHAVKQGE